jgi:hypothetical protein
MARLGAVLVGVLVVALSSANGAASAAPSPGEEPLRLRAYVACGLSKQAAPARECPHNKSKVGAFLRANREVSYSICVTYPTQKRLCAHAQEAEAGVPDLVTVTTDLVGLHKVVWTVEGRRLVRYFRRL